MNIKTKYEIGTHIWIAYEAKGEVSVYDDYIADIVISNDGLIYGTKEAYQEIKEEDIILYEELDKLAEKVKQVMQEIREKEASKDDRDNS